MMNNNIEEQQNATKVGVIQNVKTVWTMTDLEKLKENPKTTRILRQ